MDVHPLTFLMLAMSVSSGLSLDILNRVVNVQWSGGLAVEFAQGST